VIVVYDVTDATTYGSLGSWIKELESHCGEEAVKLLIGNKSDQAEQRAVATEQSAEFASEHGLLFMEASAKESTNVQAAFRLLVAEVMQRADTLANEPPAFQEKVRRQSAPAARPWQRFRRTSLSHVAADRAPRATRDALSSLGAPCPHAQVRLHAERSKYRGGVQCCQ
jgi:hypothetical protein